MGLGGGGDFLSLTQSVESTGRGNSSVVAGALDSRSKGRGFESRQERRENVLLQGQLFVLLLFRYPFHPRVTAVARKRSRSF